jgi:hypothetical protein
MTSQEIDRIECAIRHIESSLDVDPWAVEIAVEAMRKQIPKKLQNLHRFRGREKCVGTCPKCGYVCCSDYGDYCGGCGQAIDWTEDER